MQSRDDGVRPFPLSTTTAHSDFLTLAAPGAMITPYSKHKPLISLIRAVRFLTSLLLTRCIDWISCCSGRLIGTKCIDGFAGRPWPSSWLRRTIPSQWCMAANSRHRMKVYFSASAFSEPPYPNHQYREAETYSSQYRYPVL